MQLTRRGKLVVSILALIVLFGFYYFVNHIWWTGYGYCWGNMDKCVGL